MKVRWLNFRDDRERFNTFCAQPGIFSTSSEDGHVFLQNQDYSLELKNASIRYMGAIFDGELQGWFKLVQCGRGLFEVHVILAPEIRNKIGLDFAREGLRQLWQDEPEATLFSLIPAFNRPALAFAVAAGFRPKGRLSHAFLKNGIWWDRVLMELRNAWCDWQ